MDPIFPSQKNKTTAVKMWVIERHNVYRAQFGFMGVVMMFLLAPHFFFREGVHLYCLTFFPDQEGRETAISRMEVYFSTKAVFGMCNGAPIL